ncbi:MAG: SufS family cysteine desulfurase [Candidatus Micrarchaeia archaeon]
MDVEKIRKDFPILKRKINGNPMVYLDSAASSQKPMQVIDAITDYYSNHNANILREVHTLGGEATEMCENSRKKIKEFVGAKNRNEIIFTKNSTEGINLIMYSWGMENIKKGDKIVVSASEHHANFIPWQQLAKIKGAKLEFLEIDNEGFLIEGEEEKIRNSKIVAMAHVSNVTGVIFDVKKICRIAKENNSISVIDASQSIPHMKTDVSRMDCDFLAFTGHKMLGPTGIGVLYGREGILEKMRPFLYGGEMAKATERKECKWNDLPYKFEAGTPNIAGIIGLRVAVEYLNKLGMEEIQKHEKEITKYATERLLDIKNLKIAGPRKYSDKKAGIISFNIAGYHAHDIGILLDEAGIEIRTGKHCAEPVHKKLGLNSSARASFYLYNTTKEIDKLSNELEKLVK